LPILLVLDFLWALHGFEVKAPEGFFARPAALERWDLKQHRGFSPVWLTPVFHALPSASPRSIADKYRVRYGLLAPNIPQIFGIRNASGYEPFCLEAVEDLLGDYWRGLDGVVDALRVMGVHWVIAPDTQYTERLQRVGEMAPGWQFLHVPDPLPFARVMPRRASSVGWRKYLHMQPSGKARVLEEGPNSIVLKTEAHGESLLWLGSFWMPGWKAMVSETFKPLGPDGTGFMTVCIPSGKSLVRLEYAPASFAVGLLIGVIILAGMLSLATLNFIERSTFASGPRRQRQYQTAMDDI
jgi:hypothetical protein